MRLFLLCFVLLVSVTPILAATFTVEKDGSGDFTIIQDAVDAASPGDTIRIGPGRFNNEQLITVPGWSSIVRVFVRQDNLTFIGSGIGNTIIGPEEPWSQDDNVDRGITGGPYYGSSQAHFEGISFENTYVAIAGDPGFDMVVRSCSFLGNVHSIFDIDGELLNVDNCLFSNLLKGGTCIRASGNEANISNCTFNINPPWHSTKILISLQGVLSTSIQGCEFGGGKVGVLWLDSASPTLSNCSFTGQNMFGASCVRLDNMTISNCLFSDQAVGIYADNSKIQINSTAITDVSDAAIGFFGNEDLIVNECILGHGSEYSVRQYGYCNKSEDEDLPHLDFTNNDWGTTDPDTIASWIYVCDYIVDYIPFIGGPVSIEKETLDGVKALFR